MSLIDFFIDTMFADAFGLQGLERDRFFSRNQIRGGKRSGKGFLLDTFLAETADLSGDDRDFFFATGAKPASKPSGRTKRDPSFDSLPEATPEEKERVRQLLRAIRRDQTPAYAAAEHPEDAPDPSDGRRDLPFDPDSLTDEQYMDFIRQWISQEQPLSGESETDRQDLRLVFVRVPSRPKRYAYLCPDPSVLEGDIVLVPFGKNNGVRKAAVIGAVNCPASLLPVPPDRMKTVIQRQFP